MSCWNWFGIFHRGGLEKCFFVQHKYDSEITILSRLEFINWIEFGKANTGMFKFGNVIIWKKVIYLCLWHQIWIDNFEFSLFKRCFVNWNNFALLLCTRVIIPRSLILIACVFCYLVLIYWIRWCSFYGLFLLCIWDRSNLSAIASAGKAPEPANPFTSSLVVFDPVTLPINLP